MWSSRRSEEPQKLVRFQHPPMGNPKFQIPMSKEIPNPKKTSGAVIWTLKFGNWSFPHRGLCSSRPPVKRLSRNK